MGSFDSVRRALRAYLTALRMTVILRDMPRRKKSVDEAPTLLDITAKLRSGPCVPALREAVKAWKGEYKGITDTTQLTTRTPG
jgi:hypothetical protein